MTAPRNLLLGLADIAERDLGKKESPRGSNRGPDLTAMFAADDLYPNGKQGTDGGYAWCASAVSHWVQRFLATPEGGIFKRLTPPRLARAFSFESWARNQGCLIITPRMIRSGEYRHQRGDIVIFTFSHIGVVASVNSTGWNFASVEGNTDDAGSREGWKVAKRARMLGVVKCFIRLTPVAVEVGGAA